MDHPLIQLGAIIVIGIAAQWVAWRTRMPSIFLLLLAGFVAGPLTGFIRPDALFGEALFPIVKLSVAIILFEGGLSLDVRELRAVGRVVGWLITAGVVVTWGITTALAYLLLGFDLSLSLLIGAILVVTGPTVIVPLMRQVRPTARVASAVKWEGIVNDPIGAILAVLVFDLMVAGGLGHAEGAVVDMLVASGAGIALGLGGAALIVGVLRWYWVPDFLQAPFVLAVVLTAFGISDLILPESGLLTVTVMGSALASQQRVTVTHIVEFKENLRVLLISALFIVLAARLPISDPFYFESTSLVFFASLVVVVRPLAVLVSTLGSAFTFRERLFMAWMAPRGIVAAAVASIFTLELIEVGYPGAERLAPAVFLVIIGTVAIYGLSARPVARRLGVARPEPDGVLIVGAFPWARDLAAVLKERKVETLLIDSNWHNVTQARQRGLKAHYGNVLADNLGEEVDLTGIGRMLAVTPNDEVNALSALHIREEFTSARVFQLPPADEVPGRARRLPRELRARILFDPAATFLEITRRYEAGAVVKQTRLTEAFDFDDYLDHYGGDALPMCTVSGAGQVRFFEVGENTKPKPGHTVIGLVFDRPDRPGETEGDQAESDQGGE